VVDESALSGLRSLSLDDLTHYKAAVNQSRRVCWQHYFPFLFLFSRKDHNEFLISEESGSVCIYWLNQEDAGPKLYLFLLPMPMNVAVLKHCLDRCRSFNNSKSTTVRMVDEEDIGVVSSLEGASAVPVCSEYIYAPKFYRSLTGGKTRNLRHNLTRIETRGDVAVRPYEVRDSADCLALLGKWWEMQKNKHESLNFQRYTIACLQNASQFNKTDLFGKVILVDGKIRSFGFAGEIREGVGNLFITYSDHNVKGLNYFLYYQLLQDMEGYEFANASRADTPGLKFAKEVLCPVSMHEIYRIHQTAV
jgi:hypothetical protein